MNIARLAPEYDAMVLDQWGVLHNGSQPYPGIIECLKALASCGTRLAVLSNSGKRANINLKRIAEMGFPPELFEIVMTSGEALWRDTAANKIKEQKFFAIERVVGDATEWSAGLDLKIVTDIQDAEAVLLMGLPDGNAVSDWQTHLELAAELKLPFYCSNPDLASPRADRMVVSPGALAHAYQKQGGDVLYYGKPHLPIFEALEAALETKRLLMIGDSLDHDIMGAHNAGWDSVLIQGGLYSKDFQFGPSEEILEKLTQKKNCPPPTYMMDTLQ
ncbi:MAG: TIGR01459 family HAD-type hydrolase [Pseudomonadota bacterium]